MSTNAASALEKHLRRVSEDETLQPELRWLLRALLDGDEDARAALERRDDPTTVQLLRELRRPGRAPYLYLVK